MTLIRRKATTVRDKIRASLDEIFVKYMESNTIVGDTDCSHSLADSIENEIYNLIIEDNDGEFDEYLYLHKAQQLVVNLDKQSYIKNQNSDNLISTLIREELPPYKFVRMKPYELSPESWESCLRKDQAMADCLVNDTEFVSTTLFQCGRCKQRKCVYRQEQTRSIDEGVTNIIKCVNCGNGWRQNN